MHRPTRLFAGEEVLPFGFTHIFKPPKEIQVETEIESSFEFTIGAAITF